ncbi:Ig-like domain-containing protein [Alisedimentitalea sp. MJ-SS2]|uniref:Ig-like domain-containing protein n=1 Tax=Aliisedimentitalea sp. MJ-SS2 TaxID=3049795 RepID=UPI002906EBBD|nr:Ig-like domain-containing protein [Alisedimentitalea sp. MJ-SS2]MDU8927485.1 Ig-like domain-containing protein [Alisedimentitalea sp. MJ-SS2]
MRPIGFTVRDSAGAVQRSELSGDSAVSSVSAGLGQEISLNLRQGDIQGYHRDGSDLMIALVDGRVIVLEGFFNASGDSARLFISADGYLNEVNLVEGANGEVYATYGVTEQWGKWSPSDDLTYLESNEVVAAVPAGDDVSMLGAGLLGGLGGGAGLLGVGAAVAGVGLVGGGGGGGGAAPRIDPTVDQEGVITIAGDDVAEDEETVVISGTAEPGSEVEVTIGDRTVTTTATDQGTWEVDFTGDNFPGDGEFDVDVTVTEDDGTVTDLDGPEVVIDLTPPDIGFDDGVASVGDMTNSGDHTDGVEIGGTGEAGATIEVTINGVTHTTTVGEDGTWGVVFTPNELPGGEYETEVTVVSTDGHGNSTTVTDTGVIDTVIGVEIGGGQVGGDNLINGSEQATGVTLTGTAEPGSTVEVTVNGVTHTTTTGADGTWSVDFATSELPTGETEVTVSAVATDVAGNVSTTESTLQVDTINEVGFNAATVEGDGVISATEHADGVTFSGTTQPGSTVTVEVNGVAHTTIADGNGNWSVDFAPGELPVGELDLPVNVTSTDAAGNVTTTSGTVRIDTVNSVTVDDGSIEGDGTINAGERSDGVTLTGTTQPGSTVMVEVNGVSRPATVDSNGNWSVDFAPGELPVGELDLPIHVTSTDAAGNTATTTGSVHIDTVNQVGFNDATIEGEGVVNAAERGDGVTLEGTTQPGATVTVEMNGVTRTVTADANGNWSADFAASELPEGEVTLPVTVTSTDAAGNVATTTGDVEIDTIVRDFDTTGTPGGIDGVVNAAEAAGGVTLTGTVEPGSTVMVDLGGVTRPAAVDANGNWTVSFAPGDIPAGNHNLQVTATATDPAGNVSTVSGSVEVDTVVDNLGFAGTPIETDGVVNAAERGDGVEISGTVEPGSIVLVTMGGMTVPATVDANGNWTAVMPAGAVAEGEYDAIVQVEVTDPHGNTDSISQSVRVDTLVNELQNAATAVEGDNVVNASEAQDGFTLTGTVEPGSSVVVQFGGQNYAATVDAAGNWSVDIPASAIAPGEYTAQAVINATDAAGNTDSITRDIEIDTTLPGAPEIASYTRDQTGIRAISTEMTDNTVAINQVHDDGSITDLGASGVDIPVLGETAYGFTPTIPDGSHLVVTSSDDAGNMSATYLVLDESSTSVVDLSNPNLGDLQIEAIDLQFAEDSQLTVTEAQIVALSDNSDTVVIHGGVDDTVTATGAVNTGQTVDVNGETHAVYMLGDSATLIIDDDINVVI